MGLERQPTNIHCNQCGKLNQASYEFCINCGVTLWKPPILADSPSKPQNNEPLNHSDSQSHLLGFWSIKDTEILGRIESLRKAGKSDYFIKNRLIGWLEQELKRRREYMLYPDIVKKVSEII